MSVNEYVCYENQIIRNCPRKTTKQEWTERLEFVYNSSKDYIALNNIESESRINYIVYRHKHLYTHDKETTSQMKWELYKKYYDIQKKQSELKVNILKAFIKKFPNIKTPSYHLQHYLDSCELYESHRLKGIEYNLPFLVETDIPLSEEDLEVLVNKPEALENNLSKNAEVTLEEFPIQENFKLEVEESSPPEVKVPQTPGISLEEFVELLQRKKPSFIGIIEKRKNVKKHTLSMLLTQEKEKTRKLQETLGQKLLQ